MAVALGQEKLGYSQQQLDILHDQVQKGDLTAVLRVYEDDIKSPIRSAVTGTLVRSLLIQVQKMKVRICWWGLRLYHIDVYSRSMWTLHYRALTNFYGPRS